jgi:molybdate transport system substrate-binding protein
MIKKIVLSSLLSLSLFASKINIAVAANVSYAIPELMNEFNKTNPMKIRTIIGSSGKLTAQISNGAPFDIFLSANMKYPNFLYNKKLTITKPIVYAKGSLVLFSHKQKDFSEGLSLLKNTKKIAIANPKTAPYGKASIEALKNAKLYKDIKHKFVYGESISQTLAYTQKATDIGIIAKSSLYSSKMKRYKKDINYMDINSKLYTPIAQGVVLINAKAKDFYEFILSAKAKEIFKKYGYIINE